MEEEEEEEERGTRGNGIFIPSARGEEGGGRREGRKKEGDKRGRRGEGVLLRDGTS